MASGAALDEGIEVVLATKGVFHCGVAGHDAGTDNGPIGVSRSGELIDVDR